MLCKSVKQDFIHMLLSCGQNQQPRSKRRAMVFWGSLPAVFISYEFQPQPTGFALDAIEVTSNCQATKVAPTLGRAVPCWAAPRGLELKPTSLIWGICGVVNHRAKGKLAIHYMHASHILQACIYANHLMVNITPLLGSLDMSLHTSSLSHIV